MADQISGLFSPFLRARRFAAARAFLSAGAVLDYGCGVGELAAEIPPQRYLGVDDDADSLAAARRRHPAHTFVTPDELERRPPAPDFDVVVALALIEHLPEPVRWLAAMRRRLRPGGRLVLTTPEPRLQGLHDLGARLGLFSREGAEQHQSLTDGATMARWAARSGLTVERSRRFLLGANQLFVLVAAGSADR